MTTRNGLISVLAFFLLVISGLALTGQWPPYNDSREYLDFKQFVDQTSPDASPPGPPGSWARVESLARALSEQALAAESTDAVLETAFMIMVGLEKELASHGAPPELLIRLRGETWDTVADETPQTTPFLEELARKRFDDIHQELESWRMISQLRRAMGRFSHDPLNAYQYYSLTSHLRKEQAESRGETKTRLTPEEWALLDYSDRLEVLSLSLYPRGYGFAFRVRGYKDGESKEYDIIWAWESGKWMVQHIKAPNGDSS
jgi:hypothetical protein